MARVALAGGETGDTSQLTSVTAGFTIEGTVVNDASGKGGAYSYKCTSDGTIRSGAYITGFNTAHPYLRLYFRLSEDATPSDACTYYLVQFRNGSVLDLYWVAISQNTDGSFTFFVVDATSDFPARTVPQAIVKSTWYRLGIDFTTGAGTGACALNLNGATVAWRQRWDKSRALATDVVLTGNRETATHNSVASGYTPVFGEHGSSSGQKLYWEIDIARPTGSTPVLQVGLADSSAPNNNYLNSDQHSLGWSASGSVAWWGSLLSTWDTYNPTATPARLCLALDIANNMIWGRVGASGLWNASALADPATNTGGVNVPFAGPFYPAAGLIDTNDTATIYSCAPDWVGTPPSGFSGWVGSALTNQQAGSTNAVYACLMSFANGTAINGRIMYMDDIEVDDAVMPRDGYLLARSPKSGTPTYNSFTKSNASTIDTVWADTPVSATNYAYSDAAADAQTALISSFSSTQTGHGNGTIAAVDTINGIQAELVAKTSSTGAGGLTIVGTPGGAGAANGANVTITYGTAPIAGDLIIVVGGSFTRASVAYGPISTASFTQLVLTTASIANYTTGIWFKWALGTETSVVCIGTANAADATAYASYILRNVDRRQWEDQTRTTATGSASAPNPASIVTVTANALVLAVGMSAVNDTTPGQPTGYTNVSNGSASDTNSLSATIASKVVATGGTTEDPSAFSSWSNGVWATWTLAVRPTTDAGSVLSLRRRFASSNTDAALTLTTSDVLYRSAIFTDTLTNINASEVGALHGLHSARQTVEDVWLTVSYSPALQGGSILGGAGAFAAPFLQKSQGVGSFFGAGQLDTSLLAKMLITASLPGAGALNAALIEQMLGFAAYSGAGALSAAIAEQLPGAAVYSGAGALVTSLVERVQGIAFYDGAGTLSAAVAELLPGLAVYSGAGLLNAATTQNMVVQSQFLGAGNLSASALAIEQILAALAGNGSLNTAAALWLPAAGAFAGAGTLDTTLTAKLLGFSAFSGAGTLNSAASLSIPVLAALSGAGAFDVALVARLIGTAGLSGIGTIDSAAVLSLPIRAILSGDGSLDAPTVAKMVVAAGLAGTGTLDANPLEFSQILAGLSGTGTLNVPLIAQLLATTALSGVGTLDTNPQKLSPILAVLSGAGTLDAALIARFLMTATLSGAGALDSNPAKFLPILAGFPGDGTLTTAVVAQLLGAAALSGTGDLIGDVSPRSQLNLLAELFGAGSVSSSLSLSAAGVAAMSGVGTLDTALLSRMLGTAALSGIGTLGSESLKLVQVRAELSGSGTLDSALLAQFLATAPLSGVGTLNSVSALSMPGTASLFGTGTLDTALLARFMGTSPLFGVGTLDSAAALSLPMQAALSGAGSLDTALIARLLDTAALSGVGALDSTPVGLISGLASLSGAGSLDTALLAQFIGAAALSGSGALDTALLAKMLGIAVLSGDGTLDSAQTRLLAGLALLSGAGAIDTALIARLLGTANLNGVGGLSGVAELRGRVDALVSLNGVGTLDSNTIQSLLSLAALSGSGTLDAAAIAKLIDTAVFPGAGTLSGDPAKSMYGLASLSGGGTLDTALLAKMVVAAAMSGTGALSTALLEQLAGIASLPGIGTLDSNPLQFMPGLASLAGVGALDSAAVARFLEAAALSGVGDLLADAVRRGQADVVVALVGAGQFEAALAVFRLLRARWNSADASARIVLSNYDLTAGLAA